MSAFDLFLAAVVLFWVMIRLKTRRVYRSRDTIQHHDEHQ
jgi:hypothetical protein